MTGPVFHAGAIQATASVDRDQFVRDLRAMQADLQRLSRNTVKIPITLDNKQLRSQAAEARKLVSGLPPAKLGLSLNTAQARRDANEFKTYIRGLSPAKLQLGATWAQQGRSDVADFRRYVKGLAATELKVGADTDRARKDVNDLRRLAGVRDININVDAEVLDALRKLGMVDEERRRLNGSNATVNIGADATRAIGMIGLVTAGLSTIAYLAPVAGAALASALAVGGSFAQAGLAGAAGFSGIGDAIKAVQAQEDQIAPAASKNTSTMKSALRAREDAYRNVARTAKQSKEQEEDAYRSLTRVGVQNTQQLADAELALARAIDNASEQISDAERTEERAHRSLIEAQNDLTKAKKEAIETNEDLKDSLDDAVLSEEDALIALRDAQRNLENAHAAGITGEDLQKVDLATRKAAEAYDQAQKSTKRLTAENEEAAKKGIEGNDQVVAAKERVRSANEAEQDAVRRLAEAHEDADAAILDAETNLYRTQQQNRQSQEDAERSLQRVRDQNTQAQEDAARAVVEAQERVTDALNQTGTSADTAGKKAAQALAKLTPEGRSFVKFIQSELKPELKDLTDSVQSAMLPGVETGLRRILDLQPMMKAGFAETGKVLGDLADEGSRMVTSGPWRADFQTILSSHNRILRDVGVSSFNVADATRSMYTEALPTVETFTNWLNTSAALFNEFIQGKRATGELGQFFRDASDKASELWDTFVNLVVAAYDLGKAWAPVGGTVLDIVNGLSSFVSWLSKLSPEFVTFLGYGILVYASFLNIGKAVAALGGASRLATAGWTKLLNLFIPDALGSKIGLASKDLGNAGTAAEGSAAKAGKFTGALSKMGAALPLVGAALIGVAAFTDAMNSSFDEMATSMGKGGYAAEQMRAELARNDESLKTSKTLAGGYAHYLGFDWVREHVVGAQTTESFTKKLEEQRKSMTALERATYDQGVAQGNWQYLLDGGQRTLQQAAGAQTILADATQRQKNLSEQVANATKSYTDRLIEQRNFMLGSIDTDIQYHESLDRLTQSVRDNGVTTDLNTEAGRANRSALQDLARAAIEHMNALGEQGASMDVIRGKENEYKDALYRSAIQIGMTKEEARTYVDQLNLTPEVINTKAVLDTREAQAVLDSFIERNSQRQLVLDVGSNILGSAGPRARGSIDIIRPVGMASGGLRAMAAGVANVVSPNTPTLIGDRKSLNESYIPHDPTSTRAQKIFDLTGKALGRKVLPQGAAEGTILGDVDASDFTKQLIELREKALAPLSDEVKTTTLPVLNNLNDLSGLTLTKTTLALQKTLDNSWKTNTLNTATASTAMQGSIQQLMNTSNTSFANMQGTIGAQVGTIANQHLNFLRGGMGSTATAAANFSHAVAVSFDQMKGNTANPIHWMIDFPFNAGLVRAWNEVNGFFALNRPMKPLPQFAAGGPVRGGAPDKDDVALWAMTGEFIMPKAMVRDFGGIDNLERARLASLGGSFKGTEGMGAGLLPRMEVGGAIDKAMAYGKAQVGKPYIWGATGPTGFDCSGLWSAMQNTLMGRAPNSRLYTTSDFSQGHGAAGLQPGLKSAFTVGVQTGHMGGTLAGTAFEATPPRVRMSPSARGSSNFPMQFFLPEAGGQFVDAPGGQAFDVAAFVREKMAPAIGMSNDMRKFFGDALPVQAGQKDMLNMIQSIIDWTTANVSAGVGTEGISGDTVAQVRAVAARYGWDKGAEWDAISQIISAESGWNPNAANPNSSARGLFQKMTSIHGPVEATAAGQADWGLRYIKDRYGDPVSALAFRRSHGWYGKGGEVKPEVFDNGGKLGPNKTGRNASSSDEWIFTDNQLRTTIRSSARSGAEQAMASTTTSNSNDNSTVVNVHMAPGTPWQDAIKEAKHIWTHANRGVHGRT